MFVDIYKMIAQTTAYFYIVFTIKDIAVFKFMKAISSMSGTFQTSLKNLKLQNLLD